jgi:hypothetical protein
MIQLLGFSAQVAPHLVVYLTAVIELSIMDQKVDAWHLNVKYCLN